MPQNTKDSSGGKSHPKPASKSGKPNPSESKQGKPGSPTGPQRHGEKKTTP